MCFVYLHIIVDTLTVDIFSQRIVEEFLYTCVDYLAVEVSYNSKDVRIQCSRLTEYSSSVVGVESDDFNTRTSFAQQHGNYMLIAQVFLCFIVFFWFPDQIAWKGWFSWSCRLCIELQRGLELGNAKVPFNLLLSSWVQAVDWFDKAITKLK